MIPGLGRSPGGGKATHPSILPGEFRGLYSPWVAKSQARLSAFHLTSVLTQCAGLAFIHHCGAQNLSRLQPQSSRLPARRSPRSSARSRVSPAAQAPVTSRSGGCRWSFSLLVLGVRGDPLLQMLPVVFWFCLLVTVWGSFLSCRGFAKPPNQTRLPYARHTHPAWTLLTLSSLPMSSWHGSPSIISLSLDSRVPWELRNSTWRYSGAQKIVGERKNVPYLEVGRTEPVCGRYTEDDRSGQG